MNVNKLSKIGLTAFQIQQVLEEYKQTSAGSHSVMTNENMQRQRKRDEIMAIEDDVIRQSLIKENAELFTRKEG